MDTLVATMAQVPFLTLASCQRVMLSCSLGSSHACLPRLSCHHVWQAHTFCRACAERNRCPCWVCSHISEAMPANTKDILKKAASENRVVNLLTDFAEAKALVPSSLSDACATCQSSFVVVLPLSHAQLPSSLSDVQHLRVHASCLPRVVVLPFSQSSGSRKLVRCATRQSSFFLPPQGGCVALQSATCRFSTVHPLCVCVSDLSCCRTVRRMSSS